MGYWTATYSEIQPRLTDWLVITGGGAVSNIELDLLNRAQEWLWQYRPWEALQATAALTVSSRVATLPADYGRLLQVYADLDGDGRPDWYFENKSDDPARHFTLVTTFAKATGRTFAIHFTGQQQYNPYARYVKTLEAFTGTGTEYSFFPADILLRCAQKLHLEDKGDRGNEYATLNASFFEALLIYENQEHAGAMIHPTTKDSAGNTVYPHDVGLDGWDTQGYRNRGYSNDTLIVGA